MNKELLNLYIHKFMPECKEADLKKGQENRLKPLLKNLLNPNNAYKDFPFKLLSLDEQAKLLYFILNISPERQIISNLTKKDVDRDYTNFIISDKHFSNENQSKNRFDDFQSLINLEQLAKNMRNEIRSPNYTNNKVLNELALSNKHIIHIISNQIKTMNYLGTYCTSPKYLKNYINYSANIILQFLNYRVITFELSRQKKRDILNTLSSELENVSNMLDRAISKHWHALDKQEKDYLNILTAQNLTEYFAHYRMHCNEFSEEIEISNILNDEAQNDKITFPKIKPQYITEKNLLVSDILTKREKIIITENRDISNFNKKIETTQMIISIMQKYGQRNCSPYSLQDIKVYFREIFMSKSSYRELQTLSIIRKYLISFNESGAKPFEKTSQYMFFREKISRGYFRELGLLDLYITNSKIRENLYNCLLKCYLFYDFFEASEYVHEITNTILKTIYSSINKR